MIGHRVAGRKEKWKGSEDGVATLCGRIAFGIRNVEKSGRQCGERLECRIDRAVRGLVER